MTQLAELKKEYNVTWEPLPDDFKLTAQPVENLEHPLLANALRESLELAGFIISSTIVASNFGLCATVKKNPIVKAPDWVYIPSVIPVKLGDIRRSYTPHAEGELPAVVMEFLSDRDNGEYSMRPIAPYGKWWFYEQILQVPIYVIFNPKSGKIEVYHLNSGRYQQQQPDANGRYWIESMQLFIGVWQGSKTDRTGYWLRWWDESENLLLWGAEKVQQERDRAEAAERRIAELMAQLEAQNEERSP